MTWLTLEGTSNGRDFFSATIRLPVLSAEANAKREDAVQNAIKVLGERHVLDSSRYVQRGDYSQHESHGADVTATWARAREKLKPLIVSAT